MMASVAMIEQRAVRTPWPPLLHRVVKTVRARGLFEPGQHLLVAISGGPDSVALLLLLHRLVPRWRLRLTAVHFNYGLRGGESDDDQAFVMSLCESLRVPLHCVPLDVRTRPKRVSLQAQAREVRYRVMAQLAEDLGVDRIAVGHTADDQAETILLWMLRGAGLTGLAGMPAERDGKIVRPLYEARRREILAFLDATGHSYRQDSSNTKLIYTRNRIRHEVLPVLSRIAPTAIEALCRMGDLCREDEQYLAGQVDQVSVSLVQVGSDGGYTIHRQRLQAETPAMQRRVLREVFRRLHPLRRVPSVATVEDVRRLLSSKGASGGHVIGGVRILLTRNALAIQPAGVALQQPGSRAVCQVESVQVPSVIEWAGTGQQIRVQEGSPAEARRFVVSREWAMIVDADRVSQPLRLRSWRVGDRFVPSGMKGRSKKLQDYFVDLKIPLSERRRIPILEASEGIVGVIGYRPDERFQVRDSTRRCLMISMGEVLTREGEL